MSSLSLLFFLLQLISIRLKHRGHKALHMYSNSQESILFLCFVVNSMRVCNKSVGFIIFFCTLLIPKGIQLALFDLSRPTCKDYKCELTEKIFLSKVNDNYYDCNPTFLVEHRAKNSILLNCLFTYTNGRNFRKGEAVVERMTPLLFTRLKEKPLLKFVSSTNFMCQMYFDGVK